MAFTTNPSSIELLPITGASLEAVVSSIGSIGVVWLSNLLLYFLRHFIVFVFLFTLSCY